MDTQDLRERLKILRDDLARTGDDSIETTLAWTLHYIADLANIVEAMLPPKETP